MVKKKRSRVPATKTPAKLAADAFEAACHRLFDLLEEPKASATKPRVPPWTSAMLAALTDLYAASIRVHEVELTLEELGVKWSHQKFTKTSERDRLEGQAFIVKHLGSDSGYLSLMPDTGPKPTLLPGDLAEDFGVICWCLRSLFRGVPRQHRYRHVFLVHGARTTPFGSMWGRNVVEAIRAAHELARRAW